MAHARAAPQVEQSRCVLPDLRIRSGRLGRVGNTDAVCVAPTRLACPFATNNIVLLSHKPLLCVFSMGADLPGVRQQSVAFSTPETSPSRPRSSARERMRRRARFAHLEYERQHHALAYAATLMLISVVRRVRFAERHGANIVPPHMGPRWPNYWYCTDPT